MSLSDAVRRIFQQDYLSPARKHGQSRVQVAVSDINHKLGWTDRYPLICSALTATSFHEELGVVLVAATEPCPSSSTMLTFSVL